jgi:hypothetical protein
MRPRKGVWMAKAEKKAKKAAKKAAKGEKKAAKQAAKGEKKAAKAAKKAAAKAELRGLDHVYVPTASFDASWKFWSEVVGLEAGETWGEGEHRGGVLSLGKSGVVVAQEQPGTKAEMGYLIEPGRPQVFVRVKSLDVIFEGMRSRGAVVVSEPHTTHWGPRGFSVQAPDGLVVSFVE